MNEIIDYLCQLFYIVIFFALLYSLGIALLYFNDLMAKCEVSSEYITTAK